MKSVSTRASLVVLLVGGSLLASCSRQADKNEGASKPAVVATDTAAKEELCAAHGAPKSLCFICDPSLRDPNRPWCNEHAKYEDRDWDCHPELQDKARLYCKEHSLYEDECFLCHPELLPKRSSAEQPVAAPKTSSASSAGGTVLKCKEHGVPEAECGICHPDRLAQTKPGEGLQVRLPSEEAATKAGVVTGSATVDSVSPGVDGFAELTFDQGKLAQITPMVGGVIRSVDANLGSHVKEGEVLARITSAEIGSAQGAYLKAIADAHLRSDTVERERGLRAERISSEKDLQEAEASHQAAVAEVRQAKQQLAVLGLSDGQIDSLARQQSTPGVLEVRAPFAGEIVERNAVRGASASAGTPLFTLADTSVLWAMVNIPETMLSRVRVGQDVVLTIDSFAGETFLGKLTWLSPQVDDRTRMTQARAEVPNTDGRLKANMFARARIVTSTSDHAVLVPQKSVQDIGGTSVVFVKEAQDLYEIRHVQLGAKRGDDVEVVEGLAQGEALVLSGSFALKSQFLISRLGAGCTD